jgi:hypothetical protein
MKTYWNKQGKYQKELDTLLPQIPPRGMADNLHIEAVRITQNALYDFYNNAGCNERLEELSWLYSYLDRFYSKKFEHVNSGYKIDYGKLYREFHKSTPYVKMIEKDLTKIADIVIITAYEHLRN